METRVESGLAPARKYALKDVLIPPVIVGALGYFVDIYDLTLFSIVRVPSLKGLGLSGEDVLNTGVTLINLQMFGMLVGGIIWGILGDKRGRISVLFGSIALYSVANLLNAMVTNTTQYGILRFLAGVGLAGELGAAITLVAESLPREIRGLGTTVVASIGICGAVFGGSISEFFDWRACYAIGGILGVVLLVLRIRLRESGLFHGVVSDTKVVRGDLGMLLRNRHRVIRYLLCILVGVPLWYAVGILMTFAPELAVSLGVSGPVTGAKSILYGYAGIVLGDVFAGLLSQFLGSRKRAIGIFLAVTAFFVAVYGRSAGVSPEAFYTICFLLGLGTGYWALFCTVAAEQFGTNLRATVTISTPNFVRGAVVPLTLGFRALSPSLGLIPAAMTVGAVCLAIAFFALSRLDETFGRDLNYLETD
ncbi:MAG: MFS transporter [Bdellovibrionales bacterium]|nr:MFS transporter [Bdellovibrionales bacterium]